jgi:PQQ-dependent dehydrogenase (methanol/ethanol family)
MKPNLPLDFRRSAMLVCALLLISSCTSRNSQPQQVTPNRVLASPTGASIAVEPEDGQWTMPAKNYASTRFSGLENINASNVANLKLAWSFSTGVVRGHEAAPIIANNTMYVITPYPNIVYALDLTQPGAPVKWKYESNPTSSSQGVACCDVVNRGLVYSDGSIFFNTLDNNTIALDAATGKELWKTKVGEINLGESMTMAPLVVKGKVLVGNSGGEFGVRGWLTALNTSDGKIAWRAYHTGPDADVLIGPNFHPYYASDQGKELGVSSWPSDAWRIGGGTMWGWISYDPEQNLIFYGTGNPGPWNPDQRPGDNKWTCGLFARNPDTGEARWFYQFSPHDLHDYDGINEQILIDMPVNGQTRKVLLRPERNGYFYVMDRANGQVLSANPFAYITTSKGVDLNTGRIITTTRRNRKLAKSCAKFVRQHRAQRIGSRRRSRRAQVSSTSRTKISAWISKDSRRTTSRVRRTSARTCGCMRARAAIAESFWLGIR